MARVYSSSETDIRWSFAPPPENSLAAGLTRLAKLVTAAAKASRVQAEAEQIVGAWRDADLGAREMSRRVEELRDNLELGLETAEDQVQDIDSSIKGAVAHGQAVIEGIRAALDVAKEACRTAS